MDRRSRIGLLLGVWLWTSSADAHEQRPAHNVELTHDEALALARERAPALVAAQASAAEAESQVDAAKVWRSNPQLSGAVGPRFRDSSTVVDWSIGAEQWIEAGGQRGDRMRAARAGATAGSARRDDARRLLLRDVSLAFVEALYWERRVALAEENLRIAESIERVATRRRDVGDAGGLEASVATLATIRAHSEVERARAFLGQTEGRVKALLGLDAATDLACRGDLRSLGISEVDAPDLARRPDMRALRADIGQAEAEAELGRANRVPSLAFGAVYTREESDDVIQGTLSIALPVFDRGQGATAVARARQRRLQAQLDATATMAMIEAETADATAERLHAAARRFEERGLRTLEHAERLATASYEAGAIPLGELLAVRRELLQAKLDYADLLLAAATARTELAATTGALR